MRIIDEGNRTHDDTECGCEADMGGLQVRILRAKDV